jgi:hypothetical protein
MNMTPVSNKTMSTRKMEVPLSPVGTGSRHCRRPEISLGRLRFEVAGREAPSVLLIDEEDWNRRLVAMILTGGGLRVSPVADLKAALTVIEAEDAAFDPFELIISFIKLPAMDPNLFYDFLVRTHRSKMIYVLKRDGGFQLYDGEHLEQGIEGDLFDVLVNRVNQLLES